MRKQLRRTVGSSIGGLWGDEPDGGHDDIQVVRVADFDYARLSVTDTIPTRRKIDAGLSAHRVLRPGDVLLEKSGGGEKQNVGRAVLWPGGDRTVSSNFINVLRPAPGHDPRYLTYVHRALYVAGHADACTKQTTGIQNLDLAAYLSTHVHVPTHRGQRAITGFLDFQNARITALADLTSKQIDETVRIPRAIRESAIGGLREVVRLGRVASTIAGSGFPHENQGLPEGDLPFIKASDLQRAHDRRTITGAANWVSHEVAASLGARVVPTGSTVLPKIGAAMLNNTRRLAGCQLVMDNNLAAVVPRAARDSDFIFEALSRLDLSQWSNPGPVPSTSERDIRALLIPWDQPKRREEAVTRVRDAMRSVAPLLDALFGRLDRLAEYRDALITEAVTGQLDVTRVSESQMNERAHAAMEGESLAAVR